MKKRDDGRAIDGGRAMDDGGAMWVARIGSCDPVCGGHLCDDDTKVYSIELVYKLSLFVFYYVNRKGRLFKSLIFIVLC
jgi:hypothetical protein